jgi:hypothetical protein
MRVKILHLNYSIKRSYLFFAFFVCISYSSSRVEGAVLSNAPAYEWWYGCSPTTAGMMMGYYDINGYGGLRYDNLVPGGTAELNTFGNSGALANQIIASSGHITDFYGGETPSGGYGKSGDDLPAPYHSIDSLADFMGTSQDALGNSNGSTRFYNFVDGSRLYYNYMPFIGVDPSYGASYADLCGMYGMYEYVTQAGYSVNTLYNQFTDNMGRTYGFSLADYQNEIDHGRVVMLQVTGHTMFGYGYDGDTIYFHDTWDANPHTMTWGTSYAGMGLYGVTVLELTGGTPVPEPGVMILLGAGLMSYACYRRKNNRDCTGY